MASDYDHADLPTLLELARHRLGHTQASFGEHLGWSMRTAQRWAAGLAQPSERTMIDIIRQVHPKDAELAAALATRANTTLESLGVGVAAPQAPSASVERVIPEALLPFVVDAVVFSLVESLDVPARKLRPGLLAALERAQTAGLGLSDLITELRMAGSRSNAGPGGR